jgi:hypothetical protein
MHEAGQAYEYQMNVSPVLGFFLGGATPQPAGSYLSQREYIAATVKLIQHRTIRRLAHVALPLQHGSCVKLLATEEAMTSAQFRIQCLARVMFIIMLTAANFSRADSQACKEISIDSVGRPVGFKSSTIEAIAPHKIGGVALFVLIWPPMYTSQVSVDILRITVGADIVPRPRPFCKRIEDIVDPKESLTCFLSLSDQDLQIVVKYKLPTTIIINGKYETRTEAIAEYISKDVLCRAKSDVPKTHI